MIPVFFYRATVSRVIDGDSFHAAIDLGFKTFLRRSCRLAGLNAPELSTGEPGKDAADFLRAQIEGKEVTILSASLDKYGRPLCVVWTDLARQADPAESVNARMINLGLAVPA
jgi:micrococcal nuclease